MIVSKRNRQVCAEVHQHRSAESEVKRGTMGRALPAPQERATERIKELSKENKRWK